jgi:hypothetical protein
VPRVEGVLEVVQDIADAIERGDDGDVDSPQWENERRLRDLEAQLVEIIRRMDTEPIRIAGQRATQVAEPDPGAIGVIG